MDKRKIQYGIVVLMLAFVFVGCGQKKKNDVKVYENTEEVTADHEEASMTAIITSMDMENNQMHFVSVLDGTDITLQYHGGVRVTDTTGADIGIDNVACGNVVDIVYYTRLFCKCEDYIFIFSRYYRKIIFQATSASSLPLP